MRGPCCSSDARGDTGGLQYRAASTRRRRSGCAGLLARFRRHCRRAAPSILRGRPLPRWTKEPASGRHVTWPPSAAAGQKARAPRDTASRRMRGPCCSSDARGDTGGLQYRAASTRRRRSGCAGLLARFRRHCRRAAPSILRGRPLPRWTKEPASGRRVTWPPSAAAGQKARAPRDTASRRMRGPCCSTDARGDTGGLQYRAASTRRRRSGCAGLLARFSQKNAAA